MRNSSLKLTSYDTTLKNQTTILKLISYPSCFSSCFPRILNGLFRVTCVFVYIANIWLPIVEKLNGSVRILVFVQYTGKIFVTRLVGVASSLIRIHSSTVLLRFNVCTGIPLNASVSTLINNFSSHKF